MNMAVSKGKKWTSCVILESVLSEVKKFCKKEQNGFANSAQFIGFAVRNELDRRMKNG